MDWNRFGILAVLVSFVIGVVIWIKTSLTRQAEKLATTTLELELKTRELLVEAVESILKQAYEARRSEVGAENITELQKFVMLRTIDDHWIDQLHNMDALRDGIGLRAWGQRDPLIEYKIEAYGMFQEMMSSARKEILGLLFKLQIVEASEPVKSKIKSVSYGAPDESPARLVPVVKNDKTGRNDLCPCGSGKKYKKCCMGK